MKRKIHYKKYIVTHKWGNDNEHTSSNAFILPDHYDHSLESYKEMVDEARKDFPDVPDSEMDCRTVVRSSWVKGFPIIRFSVPANTVMKDWQSCEGRLPDIGWD